MLARAVLNNALWCDTVCGHRGRFEHSLWLGPEVVPAFYPHAITLRASDGAQLEILSRVLGPGPRAVKDSFAAHDLRGLGFGLLFEAEWLGLASPARGEVEEWRRLPDPDPSVARLQILRGGAVLGRGILSFGAEAVGLSNVETAGAPGAEHAVRGTLVAAAAQLWPSTPVVGYEPLPGGATDSDSGWAVMRDLGFEPLGRLKVWTR